MIQDKAKQADYQKEWNGVRAFQNRIQANLNASGMMFGTGATHAIRDISHNLVLLFAFSVFESVLKQLKAEKYFVSKNNSLGNLMHKSKKYLPWQNFPLIDEAKEKRNDIAHRQTLLPRGDCWKYIDAIENELVQWGVIKSQATFQH
jgi:hypothetical protein